MRVNVAQLMKQGVGEKRQYQVKESDPESGSEVEGEVEFLRTHRSILVRGTLRSSAPCVCVRCLREYPQPLNLHIEEEYFPTLDISSGLLLPAPEEVEAFTIDENHELDLEEALRQYTLLALPMKPLCRPECAGLCSRCGADLNRGPCGCPPPSGPRRWEALLGQLQGARERSA